jgi:hypothetical protein
VRSADMAKTTNSADRELGAISSILKALARPIREIAVFWSD